jgi:CheY-like chemotaxis protein
MSTVLVVEDDEAFAYVAAKIVERAGHRVITASGSLAALNVLDAGRWIDLILTDIRMPPGEPHGFALCKMARARRPHLPVIFMTAYPNLAEHADPDDTVLSKPLDEAVLVAEVNARLAARSAAVTPAVSARDYLEKALQAFRIANELPTWREAQALSAVAEDYLRLAEKVAATHSAGKPLKGV